MTSFPNSIQSFPTMQDISVADASPVQQYYAEKFSNGYIVSATQPAGQANGDFWFKLDRKLGTTT